MRLLGWTAILTACRWATSAQNIEPPAAFDPREATIQTVHNALFSRLTTCRGIVESFLARIEEFNPTINAISSLNPDALSTADEMDMAIARGNATGSLFCVPMLLKDNYDATPMNTTGSCLGFAGLKPTVDAPSVTALRNAGALILGKASLHELALEGLSVSSYGGQVINPYDHNRTPGGSSGGTGASVATSFAVFGTGSDTVNSLRSPASANNLFSFRPTRGLISRAGIIPISYTQDTIGAIGRSVEDLAVALTVMSSVGYDPNDNVTALTPPESRNIDYSSSLYGSSLKGLRFGLLEGFFNRTGSNETTPVNSAMSSMISKLTAAGATVIQINDTTIYNATAISSACDVQQFEYRQELDAYLSRPTLTGHFPPTMEDLYTQTSEFLVIPSQYPYVSNAIVSSTTSPTNSSTYLSHLSSISALRTAISTTFTTNSLNALIYPEQKNLVVPIGSPSQSGRNGILAAVTGYPVITVPAGFSPKTPTAPIGIPIGMEILGLPFSEPTMLGIAKEIQDLTRLRRMPAFANASVEVGGSGVVPNLIPDKGNVSPKYPVGMI